MAYETANQLRELVMDQLDTDKVKGKDRLTALEELIELLDTERELLQEQVDEAAIENVDDDHEDIGINEDPGM